MQETDVLIYVTYA